MGKKRVYFAYSWEFRGSERVEEIKRRISGSVELVDPYEVAEGIEERIAELDLRLIDGCHVVLAWLPRGWESTELGMELMYALLRGKEVLVLGHLREKPFHRWLSRRAKVFGALEGLEKYFGEKKGGRTVDIARIVRENREILIRELLGEEPTEERTDLCYFCGRPFKQSQGEYCPSCDTWKCPHCGKCLCDASPEARRILDREMISLGLWEDPFHNEELQRRIAERIGRAIKVG